MYVNSFDAKTEAETILSESKAKSQKLIEASQRETEFCAAARTAVPALIAEVRRLQNLTSQVDEYLLDINRLQTELKELKEFYGD